MPLRNDEISKTAVIFDLRDPVRMAEKSRGAEGEADGKDEQREAGICHRLIYALNPFPLSGVS